MLDKRILRNFHRTVAFDQVPKGTIGQVEVQSVRVVEVVFCDVDLSLIDTCMVSILLL